ncbi:MAG: hypothetical protein OXC40_02830 [Proteobacteria bacterium]|nr:hypothetical protein [Pseudomonadota bacterium]
MKYYFLKKTVCLCGILYLALYGVVGTAQARSAKHEAVLEDKIQTSCEQVKQSLAKTVRYLSRYTDKAKSAHEKRWAKLATAKVNCRHKKKAALYLKLAAQVRASHHEKIGVLVPEYLYNQSLRASFVQGVKNACHEASLCTPSEHLVIRYLTDPQPKKLIRHITELLYNKGVSVIIGGFDEGSHRYLNQISKVFAVPVFLMTPRENISKLPPYSFVFSPSEKFLLEGLVSFWSQKNVKRIALLEPKHSDGSIEKYLLEITESQPMTLAKTIHYHPNYQSMLTTSKEILQLLPHQRQDEWQQLLENHKLATEQEDLNTEEQQLTEEELFLEPKFDYDVLLIADNARIVRHFVKLFRYLRLTKPIPLAGTHLWRAQEIIKPWDPLLEGAYFVDFIGEYSQLLKAMDLTEREGYHEDMSKYLVDPSMMANMDFQLLGYRATHMALKVAFLPGASRHHMGKIIRQRMSADSTNRPHEIRWPTHLFQLSKGHLREVATTRSKSHE